MLGIVGTVPDRGFPLTRGEANLENGRLTVDNWPVGLARGTAALVAAACAACLVLETEAPHAFLAGDQGLGEGTGEVYALLEQTLPESGFQALMFHYLMPDVDWQGRVLMAVRAMGHRPLLMADAGHMYAAKMSGQASEYDLFTPDAGELAFLADEEAPHPFYTRGFILQEEDRAPEHVRRAYAHGNAARVLLVKGRQDLVATEKGVVATIGDNPVPAMEAMGGTGDTVSGVAAALAASGMDLPRACEAAARTNRLAGKLAEPDPATQVAAIIERIPEALARVLDKQDAKQVA